MHRVYLGQGRHREHMSWGKTHHTWDPEKVQLGKNAKRKEVQGEMRKGTEAWCQTEKSLVCHVLFYSSFQEQYEHSICLIQEDIIRFIFLKISLSCDQSVGGIQRTGEPSPQAFCSQLSVSGGEAGVWTRSGK